LYINVKYHIIRFSEYISNTYILIPIFVLSFIIFSRFQPVFLKFKKKNNNCNYLLTIAKKEKSSAYSKDDIWVISINKNFEKNTTFLAKSVFYGPNGNSAVEVYHHKQNNNFICKYIII